MNQINTKIFFILFFAASLHAKTLEYVFQRLSIEDGLSQSTILSIIQDKEGFIWLGTGNGLNKYDGYKFSIYTNNPYDSTSISDNAITSILEDKNGKIWIGTQTGILNKYNKLTDSFERFTIKNTLDSIPEQKGKYYDYPIIFSRNDNSAITAIEEDENNNLWLGTWGKGICRFNKSTGDVKHFYNNPKNPNGLSYNRIREIVIDNGIMWVGTFGGGLFKAEISNNKKITFEKFKPDKDKNSLKDEKISALYLDKNHNLWIGTYNGGLNLLTSGQMKLPVNEAKFVKFDNWQNKYSYPIMAISQDNQQNIWIGTFGRGLNRLNLKDNSFINFMKNPLEPNSLTGNDVLSLCLDQSGILWVGTHLGEGVTKLQMTSVKFGHIKSEPSNSNSLSDDIVWSIFQDNSKILWIGTYRGGLNKFNRKKNKFTVYKHDTNNENSISENHIRSIAKDKFNNLWIGTYGQGLNKFNPKTEKFVKYKYDPANPESIGANQIQDIYVDSNSTVWLAAFGGGLNKFTIKNNSNNIEFKKYLNDPSNPKSISDDRVYSIYEDKNGALWIGTFGGGLNKFDKKNETFIHYKNIPDDINSLSDNRVLTVFEDSHLNIWIGTYGGGLNKFDRKSQKFFRYKKKNGLNCDVIYGIMEDKHNNLWISSDNGIYKFNYLTENITHFDLQDGVQSLEFSGGAFFEAENGEMFFGGINGINYFYPDSVKGSAYTPNVVITSIKISNEIIKGERKKLILSHDENFLSFEFSSLDYSNPADIIYKYKLEGLEDSWHNVNANMRSVNYTNLPPGEYNFLVMGSNSDRIFSTEGVSLPITILPPFWQTWWFISLSILITLLIIYYLSTLRIKNLLAIERLKTKLAADLHDNIGSGLTEISILSELAEKDFEKLSNRQHNKLKKISDKSRTLIDNMSDIVWVVNPKRDSLHDLIIRLKDSYSDFLSSINISLNTTDLDKLDNIKLPMEYRQNLFLILKEGINNCIKHSHCKKIYLDANVRDNLIEMILKDDGIGLNNLNADHGNGLKNMKNRADAIGGKISWNSSKNEGTIIHFIGKINTLNKFKLFFKELN